MELGRGSACIQPRLRPSMPFANALVAFEFGRVVSCLCYYTLRATVCISYSVLPDCTSLFHLAAVPLPPPSFQGPYLPGYAATPDEPHICYGLQRLDHAVGNVPKLIEQVEHVMRFTGGGGAHRSVSCHLSVLSLK